MREDWLDADVAPVGVATARDIAVLAIAPHWYFCYIVTIPGYEDLSPSERWKITSKARKLQGESSVDAERLRAALRRVFSSMLDLSRADTAVLQRRNAGPVASKLYKLGNIDGKYAESGKQSERALVHNNPMGREFVTRLLSCHGIPD